jgi:hypothetical protein
MDRVILNNSVPNLLEEINPLDDLTEEVHEDNGLSALSRIAPSFVNALLS